MNLKPLSHLTTLTVVIALVLTVFWTQASCRDDAVTCSAGEVYCPEVDSCVNTANSPDHCGACGNECQESWRCIMGECTPACPADQMDCNPSASLLECVYLDRDRNYCGNCDTACAEDEVCRAGECIPCEPPEVRCENACADLNDDIQHCGECNHPCTDAEEPYCNCGECAAEPATDPCPGADADADGDTDADADGDTDADADGDIDADADGDTDADAD